MTAPELTESSIDAGNKSSPKLVALTSLQKDILQLIQNKIFLGKYTERRYVESLQDYRDVIAIEPNDVVVSSLTKVKELLETYAGNKWIGISKDPQNSDSNEYLIWVQLNNLPVGKHWFQLSAIHIKEIEILLEVQYIQPYCAPDKSFNCNDTDFPSFDPKEIFTYPNMCEAVRFIAIVFMTIFTFLIEVVRYLGDYSIQLSYVLVSLVKVSTPIWLGILDFFTKCVGGLYWLIYVMFKGNAKTPIIPGALLNNQRQIRYSPPYKENSYPNIKATYRHQRRY